MPSEKIELPKPEVWLVTWDGSPGWSQYHDERDPLPDKWDDEPPDVTQGFFSGDQVRELILAERERCARLVMMHGVPMLAVDPHDCELIANAIRKG